MKVREIKKENTEKGKVDKISLIIKRDREDESKVLLSINCLVESGLSVEEIENKILYHLEKWNRHNVPSERRRVLRDIADELKVRLPPAFYVIENDFPENDSTISSHIK